jgi:protein SCO1/2
VLAVDLEKKLITVRHEDIQGFMPAMTMNFPVSRVELLDGREPGELISATLEVADSVGRLTSIARVGMQPLPADTNTATIAASMLNPGDVLPDMALIDQDDRRRSLIEWRGSATLITFIYTRCPLPDYCPLMDQNFARIQAEIAADERLRGHAKLMSVSFDPEHDTPAVLKAHAARLKADPNVWTFLTGDRSTIDRLTARLGVGLTRERDATITHNLRTALVDASGRLVRVYSGNAWKITDVLGDLRAARRP